MTWIIVCISWCTIALRAFGNWLVVDAGCVALAGALLQSARLLRYPRGGRARRVGALVSAAEIFSWNVFID